MTRWFLPLCMGFLAAAWSPSDTQAPSPAITLPCVVTEVYDGDTITVEVRLPVRVRLLDCWAPELNEAGGRHSRAHLERLALGQPARLHVPLDAVRRSDGVFSFGRILGHVWLEGDSRSLSARQVTAGHATETKP